MRYESGLLPFSSETKNNILKEYDTDEEGLQQDVEIIRNWMKSQNHLPEIMCDEAIEIFLLLSKLSIEKCKGCIDMYYTCRTLVPDFFLNANPKLQSMKDAQEVFYWVPLPKLTPDHYRILFYKFRDYNTQRFDPFILYSFIYNCVVEIRLKEDFCNGDLIICDLDNVRLGHVKKFTPTLIAKTLVIYEKVYCNRLKGVYLVNCPTIVDTFVALLKSLMKPKLANRIHVFRNMEDFLDKFDVNLLPKDYGGLQPSLETLRELLDKKLVEYQDRFDLLDTLKVDESLRPEKLKNDELLGFYGNFKKLNVD